MLLFFSPLKQARKHILHEPRHDKTCFCYMRTTKAQISLRIRIQKNIAQHFLSYMHSADATLQVPSREDDMFFRYRPLKIEKQNANVYKTSGSSGECLGHRGRSIERA